MSIPFDPANTVAVVVGIESYKAGDRWALNGPALDAVAFVEWLRAHSVPPANILLYLSPLAANEAEIATRLAAVGVVTKAEATTDQIRAAFQSGIKTAAANAKLLYVFWGGHGAMESDNERRLFCHDANVGDFNPLNLESLLETLRSRPWSRIRDQIIVVDTCANYYEEMSYRQNQADVRFSKGADELGGLDQLVILAAASGEKAGNDPVRRSGAFSQRFLRGIEASPYNDWPDFNKLARSIEDDFATLSSDGSDRQHPVALRWRTSDGRGGAVQAYPVSRALQDTANEGNVGVGQLRKLVGIALAANMFVDLHARDALVAAMDASVRNAIERKPDNAEHDLLQIFANTLNEKQRSRQLVRAIELQDGNNASRATLIEAIKSVLVAIAVRESLGNKLISTEDLRRHYRDSLPDVQLAQPVYTLDEVIDQLNDCSPRSKDAVPPAMEFMVRIARDQNIPALEQRVVTWCVEDGRMGGFVTLSKALDDERKGASQGNATLYVDASQLDSTGTIQPSLRFHLHDARNRQIGTDTVWVETRNGESVERSRNRALAKVLQQASALLATDAKASSMNIELFVTMEQLTWCFDEWKTDVDDEDSPALGHVYPMLLRWVERSRVQGSTLTQERRNAWSRAATNIRASVDQDVALDLKWVLRAGPEPSILEAMIQARDFRSVMLLEFVPGFDENFKTERRLVKAVLQGGAPYLLWWRSQQDAKTVGAELQWEMAPKTFDAFPAKSAKLRLEAALQQNTLGKSLVVLWDDPARNPLGLLFSHLTQRPT